MLDAIRQFFDREMRPAKRPDENDTHRLQVATAALLIEMARMDEQVQTDERQAVLHAVRRHFGLRPADADELLRLAEAQAQQATDYFQFTSLINRAFSAEEKERMIEQLWRVAYADGELHKYEEHLVRKVADLLYVPHKVFIATKLRARDNAGPPSDPIGP